MERFDLIYCRNILHFDIFMKILSHSDYKIRKHIAMLLFLLVLDRCPKNIVPTLESEDLAKSKSFIIEIRQLLMKNALFLPFSILLASNLSHFNGLLPPRSD